MKNTIKVRQTHKDRLFCNLFSKKENALSLYNALNGTDYKNENELEIVTLEDAFEHPVKGYDWTAHVININPDNNVSLLKNCSVLAGYTELIHQIRTRKQSGCTIETAIHQAVKHCIDNDILKTYLLKNEGEVMSMILTEYDEELHNETLREEGMEKGIENGLHFAKMIFTLHKSGKSDIEIADTVGISLDKVKNLLY